MSNVKRDVHDTTEDTIRLSVHLTADELDTICADLMQQGDRCFDNIGALNRDAREKRIARGDFRHALAGKIRAASMSEPDANVTVDGALSPREQVIGHTVFGGTFQIAVPMPGGELSPADLADAAFDITHKICASANFDEQATRKFSGRLFERFFPEGTL